MSFQFSALQLLVLNHFVFSDALHGVKIFSLLVLDKKDLAERSYSESLQNVEVFKCGEFTRISGIDSGGPTGSSLRVPL